MNLGEYMEINRTALDKKSIKIIKRVGQLIAYYKLGKVDGCEPPRVSIASKDYQEIEKCLKAKRCNPPYTISGVELVPKQMH